MTDSLVDLANEALRISESRYRRLFETTLDGILLLNADTAPIEDVNPFLINMLGYSHAEFLGKKIWEVGSFADFTQSKEMFAELQKKGHVRYEDLPLKTKAGALIQVEFVSNSYDCEGIKVIQCDIRDITERKAAEAKILRHTHLYAALSQSNKAIVHCVSEQELFLQVCRAAVQFGGMKMAWIGIIDNATHTVLPVASFGDSTGYLKEIDISVDADSPFGHGPTGSAGRNNCPYWCQNFMNDTGTIPWHERATRAGLVASASLPLHNKGIVLGVFSLYSGDVDSFDELECNLLIEMAADVSFALDNFSRENARQWAEQQLQIAAVAFESQQAMIITDPNQVILRVNQAFTIITGYSSEESIGKTPAMLKSGRQDEKFYQNMRESLSHDHFWQGEIQDRRKNGEVYPELLSISAVLNSDGRVTNYVATFSDISQQKQAEETIHKLAFYDSLTGLPNRRLLQDRLQQSLLSVARKQYQGAVLFIDLDDFKSINDTRGHDVGDLLLVEVANRIQTCIHMDDTLARMGSDEFVVVLDTLSRVPDQAAKQAMGVAERIHKAIKSAFELRGQAYYSSACIGISLFNEFENTVVDLLKNVDAAMFQAKQSGRDKIHFFDSGIQAALEERVNLESSLRQAIPEQLRLYYQMQVDINNNIQSAEVLIRWQHPDKGIISPVVFIPLAEETGLIHPIGHWVLETACLQLKAWEANLSTRHLLLAVNVSAKQFNEPGFVKQVLDVLEQTILLKNSFFSHVEKILAS